VGTGTGAESPVLTRVRELVEPIAADLGLDLYDVEQRGGMLRISLDTPAGSDSGITLETLALASRLVSRELDHHDPVPGRYTLEVTSPGIERSLRTPEHFRREIGKVVAIRLSDVGHDDRRVTGTLVAADDSTATVRVDAPDGPIERAIPYPQIDRARTVFEWGTAEGTKAAHANTKRKKEKT
jgi:ribosome maturation factor RimP